MLLMPAIPTPAFKNRGMGISKVKIKFLKNIPRGALCRSKEEWRTEACRDSHDLYMGRTAIQFLTPHAPLFSDAPRRVV
jgi:hypothetical protein